MHQIYSCSDENLEVFTVISSKSCSPIRRKAKSPQCILSKTVVAVPDYHSQGTDELLSHQAEISKQQTFSCGINQSYVKSLQTQASPRSHHNAKWITTSDPAIRDSVGEHSRYAKLSCKNTEDDTALTHKTEASLPLTGGALHGTPSLLRKIWMKHKKKAEYLGATNGAFEAD
ncbi:vexin isoform X2 [Sphaerodactylus townsendi]|uniref:vexin isoform X2 n=1 Tax=Sphaerodactylus townsendi TaxID=933632 RepID=UPI002027459F|nr:vexin isoform X2 [Sphaerodactylus townsendi]